MAGATVKMGVDVTQFKSGLQQAQQSVKTLDAELKKNEAQLKATGDKETYLANKSRILKQELEAQKTAANNAEKALEAMAKNGVDTTSTEYQKMAAQLANAQAAMYNTQAALNNLTVSETKAGAGATQLNTDLRSINKTVSFEAVISGINSITGALEGAASKAAQVGKSIFDTIMDSARWADDAQTMAQMYEVPLDTYLRMQALVATGLDTSVDAMLGSMGKMKKGVGNESKAVMDTLKELGLVVTEYGGKTEQGFDQLITKDQTELFFKAGKAIMEMGDAYDKEAAAQSLFGKSWRELIPLFTEYDSAESFNEALEGMNVNSEDSVNKLAELNDAMQALENDFNVLKTDVLSALAPALKDAANALSGLLQNVKEYLETPEGQQALKDMEEAVSGLFSDLSKIDPEQVVSGFKEVFDTIVSGLQWLVENKNTVVSALEAIVIGWGALKLTGGALKILELVNGIRGLGGANGVTNAMQQIAAGGGGTAGAGAGGTAAAGAANSTFWTAIKTGGAKILSAIAAPLVGTVLSAAAFYGIAKGASANNYTYRGTYDPTRYSDMDNAKQLQTGVRGVLGSSGSNAAWNLGYFTSHISTPEQLFSLFNYTDSKLGDTNWLTNTGGTNSQMAAAIWAMYSHRFGGANTDLFNNLTAEQQAMLLGGQSSYAEIQQSGGSLDYTWLLTGMKDYFAHNGVFDENGDWTIPGIEEATTSQTEAADSMKAAAEVMTELPEKSAEAIQNAIEKVTIKVDFASMFGFHANGIWSVPWDGYPAILHKGERVMTAQENRNYTYNNNTYFGNVNLNNGLEIEALTESIDQRNRRRNDGYGC